jgi:hypothetical protein
MAAWRSTLDNNNKNRRFSLWDSKQKLFLLLLYLGAQVVGLGQVAVQVVVHREPRVVALVRGGVRRGPRRRQGETLS